MSDDEDPRQPSWIADVRTIGSIVGALAVAVAGGGVGFGVSSSKEAKTLVDVAQLEAQHAREREMLGNELILSNAKRIEDLKDRLDAVIAQRERCGAELAEQFGIEMPPLPPDC